jgi:hypothetical protein
VSFSQRRHIGFRKKYEFDKKRVVISSGSEIAVIGYNQLEKPYEIFRGEINLEDEVINDDMDEVETPRLGKQY